MSLTMLLVDDNSVNLHLLDTYCRKQGHHSMTATDGLQAVEIYKAAAATDVDGDTETWYSIDEGRIMHHPKGWPQVILMDINMPIMDGFEATRRIRAFEKSTGATTHRALIIALTGIGSEEARKEAFVSGIDLFFQKPVKLKELTRVLEQTFQPVNG